MIGSALAFSPVISAPAFAQEKKEEKKEEKKGDEKKKSEGKKGDEKKSDGKKGDEKKMWLLALTAWQSSRAGSSPPGFFVPDPCLAFSIRLAYRRRNRSCGRRSSRAWITAKILVRP